MPLGVLTMLVWSLDYRLDVPNKPNTDPVWTNFLTSNLRNNWRSELTVVIETWTPSNSRSPNNTLCRLLTTLLTLQCMLWRWPAFLCGLRWWRFLALYGCPFFARQSYFNAGNRISGIKTFLFYKLKFRLKASWGSFIEQRFTSLTSKRKIWNLEGNISKSRHLRLTQSTQTLSERF